METLIFFYQLVNPVFTLRVSEFPMAGKFSTSDLPMSIRLLVVLDHPRYVFIK
jgi:hypothetical protein